MDFKKYKRVVFLFVIFMVAVFFISSCGKNDASVATPSGQGIETGAPSDFSRDGSDGRDVDNSSVMFTVTKIIGNEITGLVNSEVNTYIIPVGIEITKMRGGSASLSEISAKTTLRLSFNEKDPSVIETISIVSTQSQRNGSSNTSGTRDPGQGGGMMNFGPPPGN